MEISMMQFKFAAVVERGGEAAVGRSHRGCFGSPWKK